MTNVPVDAYFSSVWSERVREHWVALSPYATHFRHAPAWAAGIPKHVAPHAPHSALEWFCYDDSGRRAAAVFWRDRMRLPGGVSVNVLRSVGRRGFVYGDSQFAPDVDLNRLAIAFQRTRFEDGSAWHVLELTRLRAMSALLVLCRALPGTLINEEPDGGVAVFDASQDYAEWERSLSVKRRDGLRYTQRRLSREGAVLRTDATEPDEVARAFDEFVELENTGWKRGHGALAGEPTDREMLRALLGSLATSGDGGVSRLYLGERLVGANLWARFGETMYWLKTAHSEEHANLSIGVAMLSHLMEQCCADPRIKRIDCVSNARWVSPWGAKMEETYSIRALNGRTLLGQLGIAKRRLRNASRDAREGA